jgi:hypothetical protein
MTEGAQFVRQGIIDPAAGPPRLDKPKRPVHPSQDSSETAKELVRAAAYTLDAETFRSVHSPSYARREAQAATERARNKLTEIEAPEIGAGGELILHPALTGKEGNALELVNTIKDPDRLTAAAELKRLDLANRTGSLDIGLDAADTIQPRNSLEKMLAHQLGALHHSAMIATEKGLMWLGKADPDMGQYGPRVQPHVANTEAARAFGAATRLMQTYQEGLLTLAKIRTGGKQQVTVNHIHQNVQAQDGSQVVVAGKMKGGTGGRKKVRGGVRK